MKPWLNMFIVALIGAVANLRAANVSLIEIKGAIGPATASYISRAIDQAAKRDDACLILRLDTPGGLVSTTEEIVGKFYASPIPVVVYVAPSPASAASAGMFITMAADVAAMAPHTKIGAAHPVSIGAGGQVEKTSDVMKQKEEAIVSAFAKSIADKRHRNAEWAKLAVVDSVAITAEEALELNVIDLIAADLPDLLKRLDGRQVAGKALHTEGAEVVAIPMNAWERFSQLFLRPEVMFILMLVVIYGIIGELSNPGAILPGVAGVIALVLVLYMSAILPVNAAGLALIGLAVALFIMDVFSPTHGVLTAGGIVAFFLGALMLFHHAGPAFKLSLGYILFATALTAAFFIFVVGAGLRAQGLPVQSGVETLLGKVVPALESVGVNGGKVFIEGELWNAVSDVPIEKDQLVEIVAVTGLTLKVKPKNK